MTDEEFSGIVRLYHSMVFRVAFGYVGNRDDAQDIAQDAFLKLYCEKKPFSGSEHIKAWLIRVTVNLARNTLKASRYAFREELTDDIPAKEADEGILDEYLLRLKPEQRTAIYLHYYEGYPVYEVAKLCGASVSAVNMRLSRGRKELAKMLGKGE